MFDRPKHQARPRRRRRSPPLEAAIAPPLEAVIVPPREIAPRRIELATAPAGKYAPAFDPKTSTWFVALGELELEAPTLAELRTKLPQGVELVP